MYRLYKDKCTEEDAVPVSSSMYRTIFNAEFNLSFHKPKKDMCLLCAQFSEEERTNVLTVALRNDYEEYVARQFEARAKKNKKKPWRRRTVQ